VLQGFNLGIEVGGHAAHFRAGFVARAPIAHDIAAPQQRAQSGHVNGLGPEHRIPQKARADLSVFLVFHLRQTALR
jgi:hypothetical protein